MVSALDEAVGNITKALEQTGQIKNTIIGINSLFYFFEIRKEPQSFYLSYLIFK